MNARKMILPTVALLLVILIPDLAAAKVKVVATLGDLAAAAEEVGGEDVDVKLLARPQEDPHYVDAKPSFVREVAQADLVVLNGMSLEIGWLPMLVKNSRNPDIQRGEPGHFDASTFIERKEVPKQQIDRSMGDVHPEGNPHYTYEPRQMARVAIALGKRLGQIDPANKAAYQKRARKFARECLQTYKHWQEKFAELPAERREVVVYHEAWIYVLDWLDLERVATVEPKPGVEPNPRHVVEVIKTIERDEIPVILKMEYYPATTVERIADKTGAKVVSSQGQTRLGKSYIDRINALASAIYKALDK
ncbi:metal ABC transporter substrate-binding protein [Persicimonas caeni]|nr:metal ABC transporter substrate-binding protein [Persicimonas caeni]